MTAKSHPRAGEFGRPLRTIEIVPSEPPVPEPLPEVEPDREPAEEPAEPIEVEP